MKAKRMMDVEPLAERMTKLGIAFDREELQRIVFRENGNREMRRKLKRRKHL